MSLASLNHFERLFDRAAPGLFLVLGLALTVAVVSLGL
jgi:hypothetical protein